MHARKQGQAPLDAADQDVGCRAITCKWNRGAYLLLARPCAAAFETMSRTTTRLLCRQRCDGPGRFLRQERQPHDQHLSIATGMVDGQLTARGRSFSPPANHNWLGGGRVRCRIPSTRNKGAYAAQVAKYFSRSGERHDNAPKLTPKGTPLTTPSPRYISYRKSNSTLSVLSRTPPF